MCIATCYSTRAARHVGAAETKVHQRKRKVWKGKKKKLNNYEGMPNQCNVLEMTTARKRTDPHALLDSQYLCAETPVSYQGLHLVSDDVAYRSAILLLQIFLAVRDVHAQATEWRRRRRISRSILPAFLPLGNRRRLVNRG